MSPAASSSPPRSARPVKLWLLRGVLVVAGLATWFATQSAIQSRQVKSSEAEMAAAGEVLLRGDALLEATRGAYEYLTADKRRAFALLIVSSLFIDVLTFFLLGRAVFGPSIRPFLGLLLLFGLRQIVQALCALPAPVGMVWESPGFPSILVTYEVANDFFFSGHTAIAIYGAIELGRLGGWKTRLLATLLAIFLTASVILVRAHYTMDVYAGAVTALLVAAWAPRLAPPVDRWLARLAGATQALEPENAAGKPAT